MSVQGRQHKSQLSDVHSEKSEIRPIFTLFAPWAGTEKAYSFVFIPYNQRNRDPCSRFHVPPTNFSLPSA